MKLYLYNCNNKNQFLEQIQTDTPQEWEGCSTEQPVRKCSMFGASFAFNPRTNDWDTLINDWRGITLFNKNNSILSKEGTVGRLEESYTPHEPPDRYNSYVWDEEQGEWKKPVVTVNPTIILQQYEDAIQRHIDKVAQERGYDNGYTCASYYRDKDPQYALDAKVFKDWRSDVWVYVNEILNQYSSQVSNLEIVTEQDLQQFPSVYQIIRNLPAIEWEDATVVQEE